MSLAVTFLMWLAGPLAASPADPAAEVRERVHAVNAAYAANDLEAYFAFYDTSLTQFWPTGRVDLPAYRKQWSEFLGEGGAVLAAEVDDLVVQVSPAGDAAIASYRLRVKTREPAGGVTEETLQETDVYFKKDGEWKIVHLHYAPAPPPAP